MLQDTPRFGIDANESSRLRDPSETDFPSVPPDDPAARSVSESVLGKDVYPEDNSTAQLESDTWRNWLPLDRSATRKPIRAKTAKNSSTTTEPTKPNSSA